MDIKFFILDNSPDSFQNNNVSDKLKNLLYSYFFMSVFILVAFVLVITPIDYFLINVLHEKSVVGEINRSSVLKSVGFLFGGLIIPFVEEFMFRLGLKIRVLNIFISFFVIFFFIFGGRIIADLSVFSKYYSQLVSAAILSVIILLFKARIIIYLTTYQKQLVYCSIILFGLIHIFNIKNFNLAIFIFYPFYVLPQIIMAYFITNLRLKYGFFWGVALHIMINSIAICCSYLTS